ncbi:MAG: gamma-glutamylcyclotransferase family protein [Beijerinckiaceae bacterium]
MPLYFAYGSNMDRTAMATRCSSSHVLGLARLPRHRFVVTADGYASVVRDATRTVHGVLWDIALGDMRGLDRYEGVERGLYSKALVSVISAQGPRKALVYFGTGAHPGQPKPGYMEGVLAAALDFMLPDPYIRELKAWMPAARHKPDLSGDIAHATAPVQSTVTPRAFAPTSDIVARPRKPRDT